MPLHTLNNFRPGSAYQSDLIETHSAIMQLPNFGTMGEMGWEADIILSAQDRNSN
jgi:hypothetical protein